MNLIETFRSELFRNFELFEDSIYLGEDVRNAHRGIAIGLHEKFGDKKVLDMPISESAFTGLGLGMAIMGKNVFVEYNFAGLVYLGLDQIFNQAHKFNEMLNTDLNLRITYILPTGTRGGLAGHHSDNPYPLLSHLGIKSVMPTNSFDCKKIFENIEKDASPVAIFLPVSSFFNKHGSELGENNYWGIYKLKSGNKLNIICTGTTLNLVMEVLEENEKLTPNVHILTDLSFSKKTVEYLHTLEKITTVFIDDSFEKCGLHSEIQKHISKDIQFESLSRKSKNISFSEEIENKIIVSKKRIEELLLNL